jgi:hypothetical protein
LKIIFKIQYIAYLLLFTIGCFSCNTNNNGTHTEDKGKALAKLNNSTLYLSDLKYATPIGVSKSDSAAFVTNVINKWASNEVFYQQAVNYLSEEELNVEKEIEEYKKELVAYKFQIKLINEKLDTLISDSQIEEYYNANTQNFLLRNNIVKVLYIKTPITIPNLEKLKKLCISTNPKDLEQLKSLCIQYANNYFMNDNTWLMFDDLKKEMTQLKEVPDYSIQSGKIFEFTDASSYYFLKVLDVKSKNTLSPLNFEKNNIKNILINQRKQKLISTIRKDFFDKAKTNKELEIYN